MTLKEFTKQRPWMGRHTWLPSTPLLFAYAAHVCFQNFKKDNIGKGNVSEMLLFELHIPNVMSKGYISYLKNQDALC